MTKNTSSVWFSYHDLRVTLDSKLLIQAECFDIYADDHVLLTGANGVGKTTLLRVLAGLNLPQRVQSHYSMSYKGQRQSVRKFRRLQQKEIVYLHQHPFMFDMSVAANVAFGLKRRGLERKLIDQKVNDALGWAGLSHLARRNARNLSGGECQRVAVTRARVLAPKLLLLDEPTAGLDQDARYRFFTLLETLRKEKVSIIMTSHEENTDKLIPDSCYEISNQQLTKC